MFDWRASANRIKANLAMEDPPKDGAEEAVLREEIKASEEAVLFMSTIGEWEYFILCSCSQSRGSVTWF